jgi:hypothetical protein
MVAASSKSTSNDIDKALEAGCECGTGAPPDKSLERFVMQLDKRVRKLAANR